MADTTPSVSVAEDPVVRALVLGFYRWLERSTDVMDPVVRTLEPGPLTSQGLRELVDEYLKGAEPTLVCTNCGHHAADHRWSGAQDCLSDACDCTHVE